MGMTKAQAKKRLKEALSKVQKVYIASYSGTARFDHPISVKDMETMQRIIDKYIKKMS